MIRGCVGQKKILLSLEPGVVFGESLFAGRFLLAYRLSPSQAAQNSRILCWFLTAVLRTCSSSWCISLPDQKSMVTPLVWKNVRKMDKMR